MVLGRSGGLGPGALVSGRPGHPLASLSMMAAASRSTPRSSADSSWSRPLSHASRARASADEELLGRGGQADDHLPPVGRVRGTGHQAHALERDDDAGHRRGLDPLVPGELPGLIGPCRFSVDSAARWVSVTEVSTRWLRSRRENRMTASRRSWASAAVSSVVLLTTQTSPDC